MVLQAGGSPDIQPRLGLVEQGHGPEDFFGGRPLLPHRRDGGSPIQGHDDFEGFLPFLHPNIVWSLAVNFCQHGPELAIVGRNPSHGKQRFDQWGRYARHGNFQRCGVHHLLQLDRDLVGRIHARDVQSIVLHHVAGAVVPRTEVGAKLAHGRAEVFGYAGGNLHELPDTGLQVEPDDQHSVAHQFGVHAWHGIQRRSLCLHLCPKARQCLFPTLLGEDSVLRSERRRFGKRRSRFTGGHGPLDLLRFLCQHSSGGRGGGRFQPGKIL